MVSVLLVLCAAALFQVCPSTNGATISYVTWQIDIGIFSNYPSAAQRDSIVKQILALWKSTFDASFQLSNEKIQVVNEQNLGQQFGNYKQVTIRISGRGPAGFNVQTIVEQFKTALSGANIAGLKTSLSSEDAGVSKTIYSFTIQVQANFAYTSNSERDSLLQQILALFQKTYSSHGLSNLKIAVDSEAGSGLPGMKLLTFHITGDSSDQIDSSSISTEFITTIQGANIPGISFETTSTDASVETSTEVTVNGGDNSNGGDNTNTNNNVNINVNGGGAGGNPFTIRGTITITFTSDSQLNQILQQILSLWIKTYGSQFGVDSGKVKINVASKVPNGSGGYTVTFTITGTSTSTVDVTSNITDFLTIIANAHINGVVTGTISGRLQWTITIDGLFSYGSPSERDNLLQTILNLWMSNFGFPNKFTDEKSSVTRETDSGRGPRTHHVTFQITGITGADIDIQAMINAFISLLQGAHIPGIEQIEGSSATGLLPNGGTGIVGGPTSFTITGHVTVKYNVKSELDRILQAILKLWIQKYGSRYGATNVKIVVSSSRPTGKGTYDVTYTITGTSSVTININIISNEFQTTVSSSKITGIVIGGGSSVTDGGNGSGEGSGEITVTDNGGGPGGKNTFTYTGKVTVTVTSDSDLRGLIQAILKLWIQKYGSTYGIGNISIKITSKVSNGSGGWIITYVITGSSSKVVTINKIQGEWTITITTSQIPGITVEGETSTPVSGEDTTPGTGEDTTTPATPGGEETPAPGGEDTTTPATPGGEETPTPGGDVTPAPGGEDTTTPATPGGEETPAPGGEDTTPATPGGEETPAPGGEGTTTPATPGGEETPAPGGEDTTTPATPGGEETPAPGGEDTTTPATPGGEETPAPGGEDTTTPATPGGEETPAPGGEDTTPGTDAGSPTPPNSNEEGGSTPGGGGEITINGNGGGEGGDKTFDLTGKITVTITTDADLRAFLQAILNLWIQKYGSIYGIGNISIKITSKVPNPTGSGWIISYEITGSSSTTVTIDTIKGEWNGIIDNSGIDGVVIGTGTITIEGGNKGEGGGEGEISIEGNGGGSGGDNKFDLTGKITVTVTTDADLRTLLQAILNLWIEKYGSTYGIGSITIKITSKVPNPTGSGFIISYEITGSSSTTVTIDTIKGEWNGFIDNAGINGVVIGTGTITTEGNGGGEGSGEGEISVKGNGGGSGGDNSFTFSSTVTVTVTSNADLTTLIKAILDLWIKQYGSTYGIGDVTIKITSKQPTASGGFTISYTITGSSSTTVPTDTIQGEWTTLINGAGITGIVVEGGEGASTEGSAGGNSFTVTGTVKVTFTTDAELDTIMQSILQLWIKTYGSMYGATNVKINVGSRVPSGSAFTITFTITGTSTTSFDVTANAAEFAGVIISAHITGVVTDEGGESSTEVSAEVTVAPDNGEGGNFAESENVRNNKDIPPGNFDVQLVVYLSYDNAAIRDNFLQRLKVNWNNALNAYVVTSLNIAFIREQLNVGTLPADQGGKPVNKVWYHLTGSTREGFNVGQVSKVFEREVIDSHLGGVEFTLAGGSASAAPSTEEAEVSATIDNTGADDSSSSNNQKPPPKKGLFGNIVDKVFGK